MIVALIKSEILLIVEKMFMIMILTVQKDEERSTFEFYFIVNSNKHEPL